MLANPRLGLALSMTFDGAELPHLFQWKMLGSGAYVLGLEPANCPVIEGRATARSNRTLPVLKPGESRHYRLAFRPAALRRHRATAPARARPGARDRSGTTRRH